MRAHHLMSHPVAVCHLGDNLQRAAQLMWDSDCGAVPVVDSSGRAVAMLTDRDICMAAYTQGKPLQQIAVSTAMSRELHACGEEDPVDRVAGLMVDHQIRRIPVLDPAGRPVGILSLNDLFRAANHQHAAMPANSDEVTLTGTAKAMAAVCAPRVIDPAPRLE